MAVIKLYQIKSKTDSLYVGLVNFGRTYRWCTTKCTLRGIDREKAIKIAKTFNGELTEKTFLPVVMGNEGYGWEIYTWCKGKADALQTLKEYRENVKGGVFKISWKWSEEKILTDDTQAA